MRTSTEKPTQLTKQQPLARIDSGRSPLRRTYFRLRQIKQSTNQPKPTITPSPSPRPKHHSDFYSHQQAALQPRQPSRIQIKQKKLSSTASNFYSNMSKMGKLSSIDRSRDSSSMRKTFHNQKSNELSPQKSQMSGGSLLFGRTSLNFHKQDIWKNENNNNYLNKYKIVKELGKGSFSTVVLAKKLQNKNTSRAASPLKLNPEGQGSRNDLDSSIDSPMLKKNQSLNARSIEGDETLPCLTNKSQQQSEQSSLVAIKVYQKFKMSKDPHKFKNIRKQINIMQNLDNPGVVKLYESVQTLTKISLVVQYGGQQSLLEYVKHNYPLPLQTVKDISYQLIKGISYLHQKNIVHRDIKLQNVLIHKGTIKIIDFGFSCLTHKAQKMTVICGTPNYMAPEVISRKEYIGQQADIWSYGVVVYALAEGRHPFKADSYNQLQRIVNRGKYQFKKVSDQPFMDFVKRLLKVKGSDRPSAAQILNMKWLKKQNSN